MISDILSQAVVDLDHYLNDPNFDRTYSGELRERIIRLRDEAEYIRIVLDTHPCDTPPNEAGDCTRKTEAMIVDERECV